MIPFKHQATPHSIYAFCLYRALQVELAQHLWRKHEIKPHQKQGHWYSSTCLVCSQEGKPVRQAILGDSTSIKPMDDEHLKMVGTNGNKGVLKI